MTAARRRPTAKRPGLGAHCARGAALAPLSRSQKTALVLLAKDAWQHVGDGRDFDTFRQQECLHAAGRQISTARNEDFLPLRAHFDNLLGRSGAAFEAHMRHSGEPRAQADHALRRECGAVAAELPDALGYAAGFLRRLGTTLDDASPNQLWNALFTVRRKVQSIRREARSNAPF